MPLASTASLACQQALLACLHWAGLTLRVSLVLLLPRATTAPSRTTTHPTGTSLSPSATQACETTVGNTQVGA